MGWESASTIYFIQRTSVFTNTSVVPGGTFSQYGLVWKPVTEVPIHEESSGLAYLTMNHTEMRTHCYY
ncbi:hypothetical protein VD0003_g4792 [Verticillium dahliae]|nr:hypothetical protein VD0003_g4792 [Verticillium dahliae]